MFYYKKKKKELKRVEDSAQASGFGAIEESNMPQLKEKKKRAVFLMATSPLTGAAWRKYHCYGRVNQPARSTQTLALMILSASCQLLWLNELYRQIACCCLDKANSARNNESGLAWKHQIMNHGSQNSLQSIAKNATPWIKRKEALMKATEWMSLRSNLLHERSQDTEVVIPFQWSSG